MDGQTGAHRLRLLLSSPVFGDRHCTANIGNRPAETHDSQTVTFQPPIETANGSWIEGAVVSGASIASGAREFDVEQELSNLGVGFAVNVKVPLHITLRWELNKL
jgi:hypothetical protein